MHPKIGNLHPKKTAQSPPTDLLWYLPSLMHSTSGGHSHFQFFCLLLRYRACAQPPDLCIEAPLFLHWNPCIFALETLSFALKQWEFCTRMDAKFAPKQVKSGVQRLQFLHPSQGVFAPKPWLFCTQTLQFLHSTGLSESSNDPLGELFHSPKNCLKKKEDTDWVFAPRSC